MERDSIYSAPGDGLGPMKGGAAGMAGEADMAFPVEGNSNTRLHTLTGDRLKENCV